MHLSLNWLSDYVDLPKNLTPSDLADLLNIHVVEVDNIISQKEQYNSIVIGKIIIIEPHPNADKLQLVGVNIGEKQLKIVCGATNIKAGQLVPVALVGAKLPGDFEIKETSIRGETSQGMLCSEKELSLGSDHSGIMILDDNAKIGQNLADYLDLNDHILEIDNKSLTHRPDLWGYIGMAREISIITNSKLKINIDSQGTEEINVAPLKELNLITAKVESPDSCPRYMAAQIENIEIKDSPLWLKKRLIASNLRPINNIVDITNYVMLETGQPMHAFDASLVIDQTSNAEITVRQAQLDEQFQALNNTSHSLSGNDLVIASNLSPVALAGIIGGANTQINQDTSSIILESANFNPIAIRVTSTRIGTRTDSSMRFEKGLDPNLTEFAISRAINTIHKILPKMTLVASPIDIKNFSQQLVIIKLNTNWLKSRIGKIIKDEDIKKTLKSLGCKVEELTQDDMNVTVPTWRAQDLTTKEDLLEEISRIIGYNNIKPVMPNVSLSSPIKSAELEIINKIKTILIGAPALTEVTNYSFVSKQHLNKCGNDATEHLQLANPLNQDLTHLRQNLIPNLLTNVKINQSATSQIGIFEIGSVFTSHESDIAKDQANAEMLPYQEKRIGIILASDQGLKEFDNIKSILAHLFDSLDIKITFNEATYSKEWCTEGSTAQIKSGNIDLGYCSVIDQGVTKKLNLKLSPMIAELRIPPMVELLTTQKTKKYKKENKFPKALRDISFVLNSKISYNEIIDEIKNFNPLISTVELFDVFTGDGVGKNKKSMAFHIAYQTDRNLENVEVDKIQDNLIKKIESRFDASVRDF